MTDSEKNILLNSRNRTSVMIDSDFLVHSGIEDIALKHPHKLAIMDADRELSYSELNRAANKISHHLLRCNPKKESLICVVMERSIDAVIAYLGVMKAGCAYAPIDPSQPDSRLNLLLQESHTQIVVTHRAVKERLHVSAKTICLDDDGEVIENESGENPQQTVESEDLAYVIYTSGSTGFPKGVEIEHASLTNLCRWYLNFFNYSADDRVTQIAGAGFDATIGEIWPTLVAGASLHLPDEETRITMDKLLRWLIDNDISITYLPTALVELFISMQLPKELKLRCLTAGGERLKRGPAQPLDFAFYNIYGPTENTDVSTYALVSNEPDQSPTIGRPIDNVEVYLFDDALQPTPSGEVGELHLGGKGLARGYRGHPEMTEERFIAHPFKPEERLYKTGDLCRFRSNGDLEFVGRNDDQVKIRGFRIELGEIEYTLSQFPGVKRTVVVVRQDKRDAPQLVGYLMPQDNVQLDTQEIIEYLKSRLPAYMVPVALVILENFPLTANQKTDKGALPEPDWAQFIDNADYEAPRSRLEKELAGIWLELLKVDMVGVKHNFFELGGHSLLVTMFLARVRERYQVDVSLVKFYRAPTIQETALYIESNQTGLFEAEQQLIKPREYEGPLPLTSAQERIWLIQSLHPGNIAYNTQTSLTFRGPLKVKALEKALNKLIERHEIFRTTFPEIDGHPVQLIHACQPVTLTIDDLSGCEDPGRRIDAITQEVCQTVFAMDELYLIRWRLIRISEEEHILLQIEHHLVHDGWSLNHLLGEISLFYNAYSVGKEPDIPELPIQFADFALFQRSWMSGTIAQQQLDFWRRTLKDCPVLELPTDRPRPPVQTFVGKAKALPISDNLYQRLVECSREAGTTLYVPMLSAYFVLLQRYSGQHDICVGAGIANRRWKETENLLGMILNNIVFRVNLEGNPTFREVIRQVQEVTLEAYENQDVSFDKVVEAVKPKRDPSYNPLCQVMFSFHNSPKRKLEFVDLEVEQNDALHNASAKFDFNIIVIPYAQQRMDADDPSTIGKAKILWEYNTDLFDDRTALRMLDHYMLLLEKITANPDQRICDFPLLLPEEQQEILTLWGRAPCEYPRESSIPELFMKQVQRHPDGIAVKCDTLSMTYEELHKRSNQLAHYLAGIGVKAGTPIGVSMDRSPELIVSLLGILKAGGCYVPLDPQYPQKRLRFMINDSGVEVIIAHSKLQEELPREGVRLVIIDVISSRLSAQPKGNPGLQISPEDLAYITYTSGSTGTPKGSAILHRGVIRLLFNTNYIQLNASERILQMATVSFDASTFEIWGSLLHGGCLVIYPDRIPSAQGIADIVRKQGVTSLFITAALFNTVVDEVPDAFASMKNVLFGGEAGSPAHVAFAVSHMPQVNFMNAYGPTENTTFSTFYPIPNHWPEDSGAVPIGRPVSNSSAYILDRHLNPVPVGVTGEIFLGGDGLAREYWKRPELTEASFVNLPLMNERLYKTGDLGKWLPDGNIAFLGRNDHQVKIRGFRIELEEIQFNLARHPDVRECLVVVHEDSPQSKRLVAYIVPVDHSRQENASETLRDWLRAKLPEYMIPSVFISLERFPLNANGKIDRSALPRPDDVRPDSQATQNLPQTASERLVYDVWREVLTAKSMGIDDNFFELGGHSLMATKIVNRLNNALPISVSISALFQHTTIRRLALFIDDLIDKDGKPA